MNYIQFRNLNYRMIEIFFLVLVTTLVQVWTKNLICAGDFQSLIPAVSTSYVPYDRPSEIYYHIYINQNLSCWYLKNSSAQIEIKKVYNPPTYPTAVCDLIGLSPYFLCQNIALEVGSQYNISFDLLTNENNNVGVTSVYVNSQIAASVVTSNYLQAYSGWANFTAKIVTNQICFYYDTSTSTVKGSNIDNVTLVKIETREYNQSVWYKKFVADQLNQKDVIIFKTNYYVPSELRSLLERNVKVYPESNPNLLLDSDFVYDNNSALEIHVSNSFIYYSQITLKFPSSIECDSQIVHYSLIENSNSNGLELISASMKWIGVIGRTFLCSYFFFSLLGIWNLLLFYNFLFIRTLPSSTYAIISTYAVIFYSESSFTDQISVLKTGLSKIQIDTYPVKIPTSMYGNVWFGNLGFSSGFLANNAEFLIILILLTLKLFIFTQVNNFFVKRANVRKITSGYRVHVFFVQIISNSPQILVCSISNFIRMDQDTFVTKVSICLNTFVVLLIAYVIFFNYLITSNVSKQRKQLKNFESIQIQKEYSVCMSFQSLNFCLLHFFVPILVVAQMKVLFFIVITLILIIRFHNFQNNKHFFKGFLYVKLLVIQLGWIIYHLVFMFFQILQTLSLDTSSTKWTNIKGILGIYIIFFILFSAILQLIDFIIAIPTKCIIPIFKMVRNICTKNNQHRIVNKFSIYDEEEAKNQLQPKVPKRKQKQKITLFSFEKKNKQILTKRTQQKAELDDLQLKFDPTNKQFQTLIIEKKLHARQRRHIPIKREKSMFDRQGKRVKSNFRQI